MTAVVRDRIALPDGDVGETRAPTTDERTGELPFLRRPCFARLLNSLPRRDQVAKLRHRTAASRGTVSGASARLA